MNISKDPLKYINSKIQEADGPKKRVLSIQDHYLDSELAGPSTSYRDEEGSSYNQKLHRRSNRRSRSASPWRRRGEREDYNYRKNDGRYSTSISPKFSHSSEDRSRHSESPDYFRFNKLKTADEYYNPFERERSESPYERERRSSYSKELEQYRKRRSQTPLSHQQSSHYEDRSPSRDRHDRRPSSSMHKTDEYDLESEDDESWDRKDSYAVHRLSKLIYNSPNYEERIKSLENNSKQETEDSDYQFPPPYSPENMDDDNDDDAVLVNKTPNTPKTPINQKVIMAPVPHMPRRMVYPQPQAFPPLVPQRMMLPRPQVPPRMMLSRPRAPIRMILPRPQVPQRLPHPSPLMMLRPQPPIGQNTIMRLQQRPILPQQRPILPQQRPILPQQRPIPPQQRPIPSEPSTTQKLTPNQKTKTMSKGAASAVETPSPQSRPRKKKKVNTRLSKVTLANGKAIFIPNYIGLNKKPPLPILNEPVDILKDLNFFVRDNYLK